MELVYACIFLFFSALFFGLSFLPDSAFEHFKEHLKKDSPPDSVADKIRKEYEKRRKA